MGLLQILKEEGIKEIQFPSPSNISIQKKSNSIGLLKKTLLLKTNNQLDFFDFTQLYKIKYSAIYKEEKNYYKISESFNFDGISIINSISTKDFWDGIIKEKNKIYFFNSNNNSILPLYQFFSFTLKNSFNSIYCIKNSKDEILMICSDDNENKLNKEIIYSFNNLLENKKLTIDNISKLEFNNNINQKIIINIDEALESFLKENTHNKDFKLVIIKEIFNRIKTYLYPNPLISYSENGQIKAIIDSTIPLQLFNQHLILSLKDLFQKHSQLITVINEGKIESYLDCYNFLGVK